MAYLYLLGAIAAELLGTSLLKATDGLTKIVPTTVCLLAYVASFALLSQTVKSVPVGVAYALWSAIGTAAIVAIGVLFLDESITWVKAGGVALIIAGVVALNLGGASH